MLRLFNTIKLQKFSQISNYVRRGKNRPRSYLQVNSETQGFMLKSQQLYPDFDLTHRHFFNTLTQTDFHQLECNEQTNTFSMIFPLGQGMQFPGINYALQKMINGGSTHYPVRNLIQAVKQKSFNNVLYTSTINQDYMMFNFATPILKDFKNLLRVYYDMMFNPLMRQEDFKELVWRYSFQVQNSRKRLVLKGQLAQNMKESDYYEQNFIYKQIIKHFFNKHNTTLCSQQQLSKITYNELVRFYDDVITHKNAILVNHGDISAEYLLSSWQELRQQKQTQRKQPQNASSQPTRSTPPSNLSPPAQASTQSLPKTVTFQHLKHQTILLLSFKIPDTASQQQKSLLSILSYILFDMPQSPFMRFNTPQTPYPQLYGFKMRYFNVGITFNDLSLSENKLTQAQIQKIMKGKQAQIFNTLQQIVEKKLPESLIQKCLSHLQANYYTQNGLSIIQNLTDLIISNKSLKSALSPLATIQRLFKRHAKQPVFEKLITKYLLQNKQYICFRGYNNYQLIQNKEFQLTQKLGEIQKSLSQEMVSNIMGFKPTNVLQDIKVLPQVQPNELEFFQDLQPKLTKVQGVNVFWENRLNCVKVTLKMDISDLDQQLFPFLELFCKSFPQMGTKTMKDDAYNQILSRFLNNIDLRYQTQKSAVDPNQMKVYMFLSVDFNDRYFEYGFGVLNGLIKAFKHDNIFALSKSIQKSASECFHSISEDIVATHGKHLAASKSPFAFFQSPIFNSRSITSMAGDLRKVTNPKQILTGISYKLQQIYLKAFQKSRTQVLFQCKQSKYQFYLKYLQLTIKQFPLSSQQSSQSLSGISIQNFPAQRWLKYFPNFSQELVFECFKFPYLQKRSAAALLFSSMVNRNILQYNKVGGCFLYKGTMLAYIQGGRKKVLQLQDYYKRIDSLDQAKRNVFRLFRRYRVKDYFQSGVSIQQARFFKQAIIATEKHQVQSILNEYVLQPLQKGQSSILSLGPRLQNYEPLLKKGWEIQRPVDDLALVVQSYSAKQPHLRLQDYTKVC